MKDQYQNNKYITDLINRQLKNNPKKSISRLFAKLRRYKRFLYNGDFQILNLIVSVLTELKIKLNRKKLLYAYNKSQELKQNSKKDKQADINQLINFNKAIEKQQSVTQNKEDHKKDDQFSIKSFSKNIYG